MKNSQYLLLFLFALQTLVSSSESTNTAVVLNPECAKGVTFWCQDIINAKKCRAVDFCINAVWSSHLSIIDSDSVCDRCKEWVGNARNFIKDNETVEEVVKDLKFSCDLIPVVGAPLVCKKIVETSIPEIMKMLESTMDPNAICSILFLCNNAEFDKILKSSSDSEKIIFSIEIQMVSVDSSVQLEEKPTCPFCLMALQEVTDLIKSNKTKESIENALNKLCNHLSDKLMSQCTEFVKDYTDEVVDMLLADFTPQDACTFITLCSDNATNYQNARIVTFGGDFDDSHDEILANPQCDLCKNIVKIVEQRVININSKDEIRRELENSCDRLKKFSAKCKSFVDKYSDRVVDMIERELAPEQVCKELTFCVTVDDDELQDYDSGLDVLGLAMKEPAKGIKEAPQCVMCEFVISELEKQLNDSATDDEIKNALLSVCSMMPKTILDTCNQFVDFYFDMIILIIVTTKPETACTEMMLCSDLDSNVPSSALINPIRNEVMTCMICKGIVSGLDSVITDKNVDKKIENLEEKLCLSLAGKYKTKCHNLTKTYGEAIIKLMETITESDQICYKMDLCSMGSATGMLKLTD